MPEILPGPDSNIEALRKFASVKLIVADLDGTLFPSELAGAVQRLIRQLARSGVQFSIATGRTWRGVQDLFRKLQEDSSKPLIKANVPIILYNGSVVVGSGTRQLRRVSVMQDGVLNNVLEIASKYQVDVFAYACHQDLTSLSNAFGITESVFGWRFKSRIVDRPETEFNGLNITWDNEWRLRPNLLPCAIILRSTKNEQKAKLAASLRRIEGISLTSSGSEFLELRPAGSNKGVALEWVAAQLGLARDEILAVGDNDNDTEMLAWAGIGVAVSTASEKARSSAHFVCNYGPFQGVLQVLRLVHQSSRYFPFPKDLSHF